MYKFFWYQKLSETPDEFFLWREKFSTSFFFVMFVIWNNKFWLIRIAAWLHFAFNSKIGFLLFSIENQDLSQCNCLKNFNINQTNCLTELFFEILSINHFLEKQNKKRYSASSIKCYHIPCKILSTVNFYQGWHLYTKICNANWKIFHRNTQCIMLDVSKNATNMQNNLLNFLRRRFFL